ncbi:hypothetical protein F5882DRAFT_446549 [Hyaloscypha sp. PMI_1271]|nr:hypothetical protein F5882DRAFT_446549 [Hyaloscypha sp. PMI_1271]
MICHVYKNLEGFIVDGYFDINAIKDQVEHLGILGKPPVSDKEILDICETKGNRINGGSSFDIRNDGEGHFSISYENDVPPGHRPISDPSAIGSLIAGGGPSQFTEPLPPGF